MKNIWTFIILIAALISRPLDLFSQFKTFSDIHDTQFNWIDEKLESFAFGKETYYYDYVNKKDGKWELYPKILIYDSVFAVNISTIEGLAGKYTFIVFYDSKSEQVIDTIGPFYDTFPNAIKVKLEKGIPTSLTLRLHNPPEPDDPIFTFVEYKHTNGKLINVRSWDKY
jgi:hypothetical protein